MITSTHLLIIVLMAITTYISRIMGYLLLSHYKLSAKAQAAMRCVPGCVLISLIAPIFMSNDPAILAGLLVTTLAVTRLSLLSTVIIAIVVTGSVRQLIL